MHQSNRIETIGFDADDTLWHNERVFRLTHARFAELLAEHGEPSHLGARLEAAERRNLGQYGFGVKGFVLSMIETALDVTDDRVPASVIRQLIEAGQEMLSHPIELLPHARETVEALASRHTLLLITKGDLLDQERKLAQSGLGELFDGVEIVSDKTPDIYRGIFARHGLAAERVAMVGNSVRSDVVPVIEAGGWGIHCPHETTWSYERHDAPIDSPRFREIGDLSALPALVESL
ncbi:HAD family hydrolase [Roseitranquillus sediminis]|uniref:HAD family hydrolase n=1 Tax=Roseitranquillus sediminis TaxID=2809051 RepID=UPI001D0CB5E1|nr:HAD family hydrolase [Roseitranquillus sediminis]MBM9593255.1 HAD family hydrolase [Roseitranquillus sediminis]